MPYRVVGANFDQMHMHTNLEWVDEQPGMDIVGVCDETPETSTGSVEQAASNLDVSDERVYDDLDRCLEATAPDIVMGCPRNSLHADFVERVTEYDIEALTIEKPMAATLDDADRMLDVIEDELFVINWPVTWNPVKHTVKRLIAEDTIGELLEIQYYGGNAGAPPDGSWFYESDGGGSMLDYLGYGATFSTWFRDGELPARVTSEIYVPEHIEVDVQSSTVCRYPAGLSTLQTTWRMLTNPWEIEPQPPKGYELVGTNGAISTRVRDGEIRVTTDDRPGGFTVEPDTLQKRHTNLASYLVDCLETGRDPAGPSNPVFCREAQRIVETARRSATLGRSLELVD